MLRDAIGLALAALLAMGACAPSAGSGLDVPRRSGRSEAERPGGRSGRCYSTSDCPERTYCTTEEGACRSCCPETGNCRESCCGVCLREPRERPRRDRSADDRGRAR